LERVTRDQEELNKSKDYTISQQNKQLKKARFSKVLGRAKTGIIAASATIGGFLFGKLLYEK